MARRPTSKPSRCMIFTIDGNLLTSNTISVKDGNNTITETDADKDMRFAIGSRELDANDLSNRHYISQSDINLSQLTKEEMDWLLQFTKTFYRKNFIELERIIPMMTQNDTKIPSFRYAMPAITAYLTQNIIRGWIFRKISDDVFLPYVIDRIKYVEGNAKKDEKPSLTLHMICMTSMCGEKQDNIACVEKVAQIHLNPSEVTRKRPSEILANNNLYIETPELIQKYDDLIKDYSDKIGTFFGTEFVFSGTPSEILEVDFDRGGKPSTSFFRSPLTHQETRCIGDIYEKNNILENKRYTNSNLNYFDDSIEIPLHPYVRVFSINTHQYFYVLPNELTKYEYRKELTDVLILPESHRSLLNMLTTQNRLLTEDLIVGKKSSNMILTIGQPGTGKTLTAEIYSEIIQRPLYRINVSELGTSPDSLEKRLKSILALADRWNAILLLDEADIYVSKRETFDIQRNAIVAQFLRIVEYFDPIFFVTSNLDTIDEAFLSRAAAVIRYTVPTDEKLLTQIWTLYLNHFNIKYSNSLLKELVTLFGTTAQRDIKNLCRLVAQNIAFNKTEPSIELFEKMSIFRNIQIKTRIPHKDPET